MRLGFLGSVLCTAVILTTLTSDLYATDGRGPRAQSKISGGRGGALASVCGRTVGLSGMKWKARQSDHITVGPRVGGYSLIFKKGVSLPSSSCLNIYDGKGNAIGRLGLYERNGLIFGARYYSGSGCAPSASSGSLASRARSKTGSPSVYIQYNGNTCIKVNNAASDQGSVS